MLNSFLSRVLPNDGHWCVVLIGDKGVVATEFIKAGGIDQVAKLIARGNTQKVNTYYGVCSFVAPHGEVLKRNGVCAKLGKFRSLRIDIDVGEGKNYQTLDYAINAVDDFVEHTQMPQPILVASGRGLHVYFPFSEDIEYPMWEVLSSGLRNLSVKHGLRFDDNICEAERLLRLPSSVNQRNNTEATIIDHGVDSTADTLYAILHPHSGAKPALVVPDHLRTAVMDAGLEEGLSEAQLQPFSAELAINTCPALSRMKEQGGAGVSEPIWKVTLDLIAQGSESPEEKWAQSVLMSQHHADYTSEGLLAKLQQVRKQDYSPPTCGTLNQPECKSCPYAARVTSPATLGVVGLLAATTIAAPTTPVVQQVTIPHSIGRVDFSKVDYDVGTFRLVNGKIFKKTKGKDDSWELVPVYPTYAIQSAVMYIAKGYNGVNITFVDTGKHPREYVLNLATDSFFDSKVLNAELAKAGILGYVATKRVILGDFLMSFIGFLQQNRAMLSKHNKIGWNDEEDSFVLGDIVINRSKQIQVHEEPVGLLTNNVPVYGTKGSEAVQIDTLNSMLVTDAAHLVIALSLATPLVRYTAFNGAIVSLYSKRSGIGKTALLKAITSIWGHPTNSLTQALTSNVAIQAKLGSAPSLPSAIDEVSTMQENQISQLLYEVSQGKGKDRLEASGARLQDQKTEWQTLMFVTTNKTLADRARAVAGDSDAILARLLEIDMPPLPEGVAVGNPDVILEDNYGWVGRKAVVAIMGYSHEQWKELIAKKVVQWGTRLGLPAVYGPDRFRIAMCALADIGATLGNGLGIKLDADAIGRCVQNVCQTTDSESKALTIDSEALLRQYMADHSYKIGKLVETPKGWSVTSRADGDVTYGEQRFLASKSGQGVTLSDTYLALHKLTAWLRAKKFDETDFRRWMSNNNGLTKPIGLYMFMENTSQSYRAEALWVSPKVSGVASMAIVKDTSIDKEIKSK